MYIWVAINVDDQLRELKSKCAELITKYHYQNVCDSLPLHISLKISFPIDEISFPEVISTISEYYVSLQPFTVELDQIERIVDVVWISLKNNTNLTRIHNELDHILKEQFNVSLHKYDLDYKFHISLFMNEDSTRIDNIYECIKCEKFSLSLVANKFTIGSSMSGEPDTYTVYKKNYHRLKNQIRRPCPWDFGSLCL